MRRHTPRYGISVVFFRHAGHCRDSDAETPTTGVDWPHNLVRAYPWAHAGMLHRVFQRPFGTVCTVWTWFVMLHLVATVMGRHHRPGFLPCGSARRGLGRSSHLADLLGRNLVIQLASQTCLMGI
jgi:hypothetical protein